MSNLVAFPRSARPAARLLVAQQTLQMSVALVEQRLRDAGASVRRIAADFALFDAALSQSVRQLRETRRECREVLDAIDSGDVRRMAALAGAIHTRRHHRVRPCEDQRP
jgi:hypothetical protein